MKAATFIAVQLVGAALCAALLVPSLGHVPDEVPRHGPHLAAAARFAPAGADDTPGALPDARLGVAREALAEAVANHTAANVELATPDGVASVTLRWKELGLAAVAASDAPAAAALARRGYRLRPTTLELNPADGDTPAATVEVLVGIHLDTAQRRLEALAARYDRQPLAARWDFRANRALGDTAGRTLDVDASLDRLIEASATSAALPERIELVARELPATVRRTPDLDGFEPSAVLAGFATGYSTRNKDRATNLALAASAIDGTVLLPGQSFSYNTTVGERSLERGYREAPVIEHGEIVEGIGGGACQVSSTLHAAALFGGVEIVERQSHSLPSSYIDMGLDAVVAWPFLDLKLRNPYPFPIVLRAYLDGDRMRAEVRGPAAGHRVVLRKEVIEEVPFAEEVVVDASLAAGTIKTQRSGKVGYKVLRGRIVWANGKETFERLPTDFYQPRSQRVVIGPDTVYPPPATAESGDALPPTSVE